MTRLNSNGTHDSSEAEARNEMTLLSDLWGLFLETLCEQGGPLVIGISGGECTGKTYLANRLLECSQSKGRDSVTLHVDGYLRLSREERRRFDPNSPDIYQRAMRIGDHPDCFDLDALNKDIEQLCENKVLARPRRYGYSRGLTVYDLPEIHISTDSLVFVDGIFALHNTVIARMPVRLFLTVEPEIVWHRYLVRHLERNTDDMKGVQRRFESLVLPSYWQYIEPTKANATAFIEYRASAAGALTMSLERL